MNIVAIIPARGGSKSVPRKNIKLLAGKPLMAYTIEEAKKSQYITRTIVTTDDEEIADISRHCGAEVPFMRPNELAQDDTTDLPVFQHCLKWLEQEENYIPDLVVHLRPTAPLRTVVHIDYGIKMMLDSPEADAVRSVCPAGQHPLKMWGFEASRLVPFIPEHVYQVPEAYNEPRQKLPKAYVQNGSVDVIRTHVISQGSSMTGKQIKGFEMGEQESVNIDSPIDWALAEKIIEARQKTN